MARPVVVRRATASLCAAIPLMFVLAGCGSSESSGDSKNSSTKKAYVLGISNPAGANPTLKYWQEAIEQQARHLGMKTIAASANFDPNKQVSDVRTLADRGIDALIVSPLNPDSIRPAIESASAKGIKIIGYEGGEGPYATNFQEQGYETAKAAALALAEKVGEGSKIAVVEGIPQLPILQARNKGFREGAKEAGLEVVAGDVNLKDTAEGSQPLVEGWRTRFGSSLKGILAYNDPSALGAAAARGGSFKPTITGFNASPEGIEGVKSGQLLATFDQRPVEVGNGLVYAAKQILDGEQVPVKIVIRMPKYDASNVASWGSPQSLLEGPLEVSFASQSGSSFLETSAGAVSEDG